MPMIAPIELEDAIPAGESARKTDRTQGRLGAARYEAQHLEVWHSFENELTKTQLQLGRHSERRAVLQRSLDSVYDHRMRVAEHERSPREDVVDVFPAVHIADSRSLSARRDDRLSAHTSKRPDGRAHPS